MTERVLGFFGHSTGCAYRELSHAYTGHPAFEFTLPASVLGTPTFPQVVVCEFSGKAVAAAHAAFLRERAAFEAIAASASPEDVDAFIAKAAADAAVGDAAISWDRALPEIAASAVWQKFASSAALQEVLLSTGDDVLALADAEDSLWGVGLSLGDSRLQDPRAWNGRNLLGEALTVARRRLRSASFVVGFYGHSPGRPFREFSNFFTGHPAFEFQLADVVVCPATTSSSTALSLPTAVRCEFAEKAIMLCKAALMNDEACFRAIAAAATPEEAKALGRRVANFDEQLWRRRLPAVAEAVVTQKFASSRELRALLLSTGNAMIAEATCDDRIWGVGRDVHDPRVQNPSQWDGENHLGKALMRARDALRQELQR